MLEGIVTGLILLAAAAYLCRYVWLAFKGKPTGCACDKPECGKHSS